MPWPMAENEQSRLRQECYGMFGDVFGGEVNAYSTLCPALPIATPRFYFGDVNRTTTHACVITSAVQWPAADKSTFEPFEVLPLSRKCDDVRLPGPPHLFYMAMFRKLGAMAALDKAGRFAASDLDWGTMPPPRISSAAG
eukprot:788648-Prymnesium_polylepis.1